MDTPANIYNKNLATLESEKTQLSTKIKSVLENGTATNEGATGNKLGKGTIKKLKQNLDAIESEIRAKKRQYKITAHQLEKTNDHQLILSASTSGWHKMSGRSAIFFATDIMPRLKNPTRFNLNPDTDSYGYSEFGVISVRIDGDFIAELKKLKILETESNEEGIRFFNLPWNYSEERIQKIINNIESNKEQINRLVMTKNLVPDLFNALDELLKMSYHACKGIKEPVAKQKFGQDFLHCVELAYCEYLKATDGTMKTAEAMNAIILEIRSSKRLLKILSTLGVIQQKDILRIGTQLLLVERTAAKTERAEKANKESEATNKK